MMRVDTLGTIPIARAFAMSFSGDWSAARSARKVSKCKRAREMS